MKRIIEVHVKPAEVEAVLDGTEIVLVTEWPSLAQVMRIALLDTNGVSYRIDVMQFVRIEEAE